MRAFARHGLIVLVVAAGYCACMVVGTVLSVPPSGFAIIWPATAFLIAALLVLPQRQWWCLVGVVPAHFLASALLAPSFRLIFATTEVFGNLLLAFTSVLVVRRLIGLTPLFDRFRSILAFILVAGLAVPAVVNLAILSVHLATGRIDDLWQAWLQWMIAGFFPTITLPPLLYLIAKGAFTDRRDTSFGHGLELAACATSSFVLAVVVFGDRADTVHWPALYLAPLLPLLLAAVRTGVGGTSVSLLALAGGIVAQALRQHGPFGAHSPMADVESLQIFLVMASAPLMLLAALMEDRQEAARRLRETDARMQLTASSTDTGLWQWDIATSYLWLTDNCRDLLVLPDDADPSLDAFVDAVHPDDRDRVAEALLAASRDGGELPPIEFRLRWGSPKRWLILVTRTDLDQRGAPVRVNGVFRNITERVLARQEVSRLHEQLVSLQDDERRRIAQELHDSTAQHLVAAGLNLDNLRWRAHPAQQDLVDEVNQSVREALAEIRTFSYLLRPPQLDHDGLTGVLEQYVPGFERRTGVATSLRLNSRADALPPELQHAILRIAQESLANVHRHANATRASVQVRCLAGNVHLVVRDDGEGIRPETGQQLGERLRLGVGIPAMNARVRQLGGRIDVNSGRSGTTIHVAIPFDNVTLPDLDTASLAESRETVGGGTSPLPVRQG